MILSLKLLLMGGLAGFAFGACVGGAVCVVRFFSGQSAMGDVFYPFAAGGAAIGFMISAVFVILIAANKWLKLIVLTK